MTINASTGAVTLTGNPNYEAPVISSGGDGAVSEKVAVSTVVYTAASSDFDANDTISYSLSGTDASAFSIDSLGAVRLTAAADYAVKTSYSIDVLATDRAGLSATKAVTVAVIPRGNVNSAPVITSGATGLWRIAPESIGVFQIGDKLKFLHARRT